MVYYPLDGCKHFTGTHLKACYYFFTFKQKVFINWQHILWTKNWNKQGLSKLENVLVYPLEKLMLIPIDLKNVRIANEIGQQEVCYL